MYLAQDQLPEALVSARQGHAAEPASPFPALLALEIMERGEASAEAHRASANRSQQHLNPCATRQLHSRYARILLDLQRNAEARAQLENLTTRQPEQAEPWLLLASLQVQDNALPAATASLETYMGLARQAATSDPLAGSRRPIC